MLRQLRCKLQGFPLAMRPNVARDPRQINARYVFLNRLPHHNVVTVLIRRPDRAIHFAYFTFIHLYKVLVT